MGEKERFEKYKKTLLKIIHNKLPECKVYLFGSRARKTNESGADIDLALDNKNPIDNKIMYLLKDEIEETTIPLMVDLVDLNSVSDEFRAQVMKEGILWKT